MSSSSPVAGRQLRRPWIGHAAVGLATLAAAVLLRAADPSILESARHAVFDSYQRLSPRPYRQAPVRVVDIDDASLERLGQWPWPRLLLAELVERLNALGAAAIAFDAVLAEPDRLSPLRLLPRLERHGLIDQTRKRPADWPDYDRALAEAMARARVVTSFGLLAAPNDTRPALKTGLAVLGESLLDSLPRHAGAVASLPQLEAAASGNGSISILSDSDEVVRQVPLLTALGGQVYPTLALEALRVAQGADTLVVRAPQSTASPLSRQAASLRVGRLEVPLEAGGLLRLHYTGAAPERGLPAWRLLEQGADTAALAAKLRGHIVLVGSSAVGLSDLRATPLNPFEPGVNIHAEAIEQMLLGAWLSRPAWATALEVLAGGLAALLVMTLLLRFGARAGTGAALLSVGGGLAGAWLAFDQVRLLLDPVFPALAVAAVYLPVSALVTIRSEQEKRFVRGAFGQYLSPAFVQRLLEDPDKLVLGGESRAMTFLFTDLEGFTSYVERSAPEALVETLNAYLDGLCGIVMEHGGTVDKIVGDAVHAMFNAPLEQPDHAARAVACALAIDAFACDFSNGLRRQGVAFGMTRIGVNTGTAIVGNFGGTRRFDYTAHGDAINTAARLEAANTLLGTRICVARSTAEHAEAFRYRPLGAIPLKGLSEGVEVFEPLAAEPVVYLAMPGDEPAAPEAAAEPEARLRA